MTLARLCFRQASVVPSGCPRVSTSQRQATLARKLYLSVCRSFCSRSYLHFEMLSRPQRRRRLSGWVPRGRQWVWEACRWYRAPSRQSKLCGQQGHLAIPLSIILLSPRSCTGLGWLLSAARLGMCFGGQLHAWAVALWPCRTGWSNASKLTMLAILSLHPRRQCAEPRDRPIPCGHKRESPPPPLPLPASF